MLWNDPLTVMPYRSGELPESLSCVRNGMLLLRESQYSRLFGFDSSLHSVHIIRSDVIPPKRDAPRGRRALNETSYPLYHSCWLSSVKTTLLTRVSAARLTL